jgi:predicted type IV restriction endonuclease
VPAPAEVLTLVDRYLAQQATYETHYNETMTRREFLDPLFHALGWDMDNRAGLPENAKEVIHEDTERKSTKWRQTLQGGLSH